MARASGTALMVTVVLAAGGLLARTAMSNPEKPAASPTKKAVATQPPEARPKLVNERILFSADDTSWVNTNKISSCLLARLSPDGKYLLYARPRGNHHQKPRSERLYDLMLRDIATGKDLRLPVPPYPSGWEDAQVRFNPFDPSGERMVLTAIHAPQNTEVVLFDVAAGKVTPTGIKGRFAFARFDHSGKRLIAAEDAQLFVASLPALQRQNIEPEGIEHGYPHSVCPTADIVCLFHVRRLPDRPLPEQPSPDRRLPNRPRHKGVITLYDLEAKKKLVDLPTHEKNSQLDDLETQWTPDGRFICYYDFADRDFGTVKGTRIWDRIAGREKAFVENTAPMGPGPEGSLIMLVGTIRYNYVPILYDVIGGQAWELGGSSIRLIHAAAGKIAYLKTLPTGAMEVCVAEIALPTAKE